MAGILDDLFEDLIKTPETAGNEPEKKEKPEDNPEGPDSNADEQMEDDEPARPNATLFPTSSDWEEFKKQHA